MNQVVGRAVMCKLRLGSTLKFRNDALGKHFPQLDAPLVEWIDIPHGSLSEDAVLIQRHQLTEHYWRKPIGEQDVRRAIALKHAMGQKPIGSTLSLHLFARLPER